MSERLRIRDQADYSSSFGLGDAQYENRALDSWAPAHHQLGAIRRSYAVGTGAIAGRGFASGFDVVANFWSGTANPGAQAIANLPEIGGGQGFTLTYLRQAATFTNQGWDFDAVWQINEGVDTPRHRWSQGSSYCSTIASDETALIGAGTAADPIRLCTVGQFETLAGDASALSKHVALMVDVDLAEFSSTLGTNSQRFKGTFDGNFHILYNFTREEPSADYVGLFGYVDGDGVFDGTNDGIVRNLTLVAPRVVGHERVVAAVGMLAPGSKVERVQVIGGTVTGKGGVGGVVGWTNAPIAMSYSTAAVELTLGSHAGGLVGMAYEQTTITDSGAAGTVIAGTLGAATGAGGLLGYSKASVQRSWARGAVTMVDGVHAGGLVAYNEVGALIEDSFAGGAVSCAGVGCGGLAGNNHQQGTIRRSYATGHVSGSESVGGLVGISSGQVSLSHATGDVSGTVDEVGGLVGWCPGSVERSYAIGNVIATGTNSAVGGLVGVVDTTNGLVTDSYATGSATGTGSVGGLIGSVTASSAVHRSYTTSIASGPATYVGKFAGQLLGTLSAARVSDNFFIGTNAEATGSPGTATGITGTTDSALKAETTFSNWNFTTTWQIDEGNAYPTLQPEGGS